MKRVLCHHPHKGWRYRYESYDSTWSSWKWFKLETRWQRRDKRLVLDGGYRIPSGYAGRVLTGRGTGTNLGTHVKPVPVGTWPACILRVCPNWKFGVVKSRGPMGDSYQIATDARHHTVTTLVPWPSDTVVIWLCKKFEPIHPAFFKSIRVPLPCHKTI